MTTNFVCCTKDQTLRDILPMFIQTNSNILPVVDDSNKLIGVITKNKMFQLLTTQPSFDTTIEPFYTPNPVFLHPSDTVEETRKLLLKHNIGHAPVVDENTIPIGVISTKQLLVIL